jgi:hypothetical protein
MNDDRTKLVPLSSLIPQPSPQASLRALHGALEATRREQEKCLIAWPCETDRVQ